jgi:hypothetical protein
LEECLEASTIQDGAALFGVMEEGRLLQVCVGVGVGVGV